MGRKKPRLKLDDKIAARHAYLCEKTHTENRRPTHKNCYSLIAYLAQQEQETGVKACPAFEMYKKVYACRGYGGLSGWANGHDAFKQISSYAEQEKLIEKQGNRKEFKFLLTDAGRELYDQTIKREMDDYIQNYTPSIKKETPKLSSAAEARKKTVNEPTKIIIDEARAKKNRGDLDGKQKEAESRRRQQAERPVKKGVIEKRKAEMQRAREALLKKQNTSPHSDRIQAEQLSSLFYDSDERLELLKSVHRKMQESKMGRK